MDQARRITHTHTHSLFLFHFSLSLSLPALTAFSLCLSQCLSALSLSLSLCSFSLSLLLYLALSLSLSLFCRASARDQEPPSKPRLVPHPCNTSWRHSPLLRQHAPASLCLSPRLHAHGAPLSRGAVTGHCHGALSRGAVTLLSGCLHALLRGGQAATTATSHLSFQRANPVWKKYRLLLLRTNKSSGHYSVLDKSCIIPANKMNR